MRKNISILGSTGSIGVQTLDVVKKLGIKVYGLTADKNIDLLEKQAREFKPRAVSISDEKDAEKLRSRLDGLNIQVYSGQEGIVRVATLEEVETVVNSIVGIAGLIPTVEAIRKGKNIALANKETLVTAGNIIMEEARKHRVDIIPIDSEHSAIFQCLLGNNKASISKLILTASGGPFRGYNRKDLVNITPQQALKHPTWKMGSKITIDCATLMNKGLEVIEARWLFNINADNIKVIIHPQSIVHSMVEFIDGSVIAQLGMPDMRLPIQFALTYPKRQSADLPKLDLTRIGSLTFEEPDLENFPCLKLAYDALKISGTMPAVMNGANEMAVSLFLSGKIKFIHIPDIIKRVMERHKVNNNPSINDIIEVDRWARMEVLKQLNFKGEII